MQPPINSFLVPGLIVLLIVLIDFSSSEALWADAYFSLGSWFQWRHLSARKFHGIIVSEKARVGKITIQLILAPAFKLFFMQSSLTDRSQAELLLWTIYVISVLFCYAFMHVCLLMPCGHLLGKGCPLGSRLWCLILMMSLSHWYLGSGVVLDCIDSWSLPSFLFCLDFAFFFLHNF